MVASETAAPGEVVTFALVARNDGTAPAAGLLVEDRLPAGLQHVPGSAPGAGYDPETGTLAWPLPVLDAGQAVSLSLAARVAAQAGETLLFPSRSRTLTNTALLTGGPEDQVRLTAGAALYVRAADVILPDSGGVLRSADGQVEVRFPAGAVSQEVAVTHRPLAPVDLLALHANAEVPPDSRIFYRFALDARAVSDPALVVAGFARPVTLSLSYSDTQVAGLMEDRLRLYSWDEEKGAWEGLATAVKSRTTG